MTSSNSEAAGRPARGKNQQQSGRAKGSDRTAGARRAGAARSSAGTVPTGWGRYLVAARPAALTPAGAPVLDPARLTRLLAEDEHVIVLAEVGRDSTAPAAGSGGSAPPVGSAEPFGTAQPNGSAPSKSSAQPTGSVEPNGSVQSYGSAQPNGSAQAYGSVQPGGPAQPYGSPQSFGSSQPNGPAQPFTSAEPFGQPPTGEPRPMCPPVNVVAMPPARAAQLAADPALICEADAPLVCTAANPLSSIAPAADPALAVPLLAPETLVVKVRDREGNPVAGAHVWALGNAFPAHALTDSSGTAILVLVADTNESLRGVHVRPAAGFWPARVPADPYQGFDGDEVTVTLRSLSEPHAGFASAALANWGSAALGAGRLPTAFRGDGVRVAVLDSGIDASHPMLKDAVRGGFDFTGDADPEGWALDRTGQGTGCAGVIAAADTGAGQGGLATEAELYALRLFPHGKVVDLLAALDWCVANGVDVAQVNVACPPSRLVEWKLADARAAGMVVTAPAGDTGTVTAFPAAVPGVIAVGALAHPDTHPDTGPQTDPDAARDAAAVRTDWSGPYTPAFTPVGADVAAPGTAIVTTAPGGEHTVADGTAIAASHITALAALLIAHHEHLRPAAGTHGARRHPTGHADRVAALLQAASRVPAGCDPGRAGAGLPDAAFALAPQAAQVAAAPAPALGAPLNTPLSTPLRAPLDRPIA